MTHISLQGSLTIGPYKGYHGRIEYDADEAAFHGRVTETKDVITFVGRDASEIETAFKESVDDYLEFCEARGEKPDKPFSGRFIVRTTPELHHRLAKCADSSGKSLNQFVVQSLESAVKAFSQSEDIGWTRGRLVSFPVEQSQEWFETRPQFVSVPLPSRF